LASILKKILGHRFSGELWTIHPDSSGKNLVLQTRDGESVAYHLYSLNEEKFLWENKAATGSFTQGIREIAFEKLIIYQKLRTEFLGQEGLTVMNLKSGEEEYTNESISMVGWNGGQMVVEFNGLNRLGLLSLTDFQLSILTGSKDSEPSEFASLPIKHPAMIDETMPTFKSIATYLLEKFNEQPIKSIDYLEHNGLILIGYYIEEPGGLTQKLVVLNQSGAVVDKLLLGSSLHGIGIDTFVIVNHHLLTIKDKHELEIFSFHF